MIVRPKISKVNGVFKGCRTYMLECEDMRSVKLQLGDQRKSIVRLGVVHCGRLKSVERDESHAAAPLAIHHLKNFARSIIVVDDNVKQAKSSVKILSRRDWPHLVPAVISTAILYLSDTSNNS